MLCVTLLFTSAHSIYSNTFTLDVQAAEVVITAEVAASVIEYLWALLLSMGLVSAAVSWSDRIPQINETMDLLAAYPEITADMTIEVTVNGKVLEVTYDQYMTYIKHNVVDGTGAVQTGSEVFTVLSGGGGKNGGDKDRFAKFCFGGMWGYLFAQAVLKRGEDSSFTDGYNPTPEELEAINAAYAELVSEDNVTISENTMTIHNYSEAAQKLMSDISYHFDIGQDYDGTVCVDETAAGGGHCVAVGAYAQDGCMCGGSFYRQTITPDDTAYDVLCIAPVKRLTYDGKNDGYNLAVALVEFTGSETARDAYGGFDFDAWKAYPYSMYQTSDLSSFEASSAEVGSVPNTVAYYLDFCTKDTSVGLSSYAVFTRMNGMNWDFLYQNINGYAPSVFGNAVWDGKAHDVDLYIRTVGQHGMPVLLLDDMQLLPAVCNGLLEQWDNNVFANYSGRRQLFTPKALSQVSKTALEGLAKELLHGGLSTDAAIDAATEIDGLRDMDVARLPEFYPDLYPEYLPEADPAKYPEIYPDYDPVTNPNPSPAVPPNPDRVVENVTETVTSPNPSPNPNPDDEAGGGLDNADLEGAAFNLSEYFPFCIPFDLIRAFKLLTAEAEVPYWEIPLHAEFLGYVLDYTFVIDMSKFEMLAKIFRLCETIGFCVGLILLTRNIIRG